MKSLSFLLAIWFAVLMLFSGCATVIVEPFNLAGMSCEAAEVRVSMMSNVALAACKEPEGSRYHVIAGQGRPSVDVGLAILQSATLVGGAVILGKAMVAAGGNIEKPWASRVEFPDND